MKIFFTVYGNPANVKNIKIHLNCISHLSGKTEIIKTKFQIILSVIKAITIFLCISSNFTIADHPHQSFSNCGL